MSTRLRFWISTLTLLGVSALAAPASAASQTCREWRAEHLEWKTRAVHRYLTGAPQAELDGALFELMQREAWLTACDLSIEGARAELVGWRLVDRSPDQYGSAVLESLLAQGGFELELRRWVGGVSAAGPRSGALASRGKPGAAH